MSKPEVFREPKNIEEPCQREIVQRDLLYVVSLGNKTSEDILHRFIDYWILNPFAGATDDYFRVDFNHFWLNCCFIRQMGC